MPVPTTPSAAPVVPGYVLEELLGRGGSGQVWRARPRSGGESVAIKVLVRGDPERQEREAVLLGELDHPHLVRLHEVVRREVRDRPAQVALVLDLLAGGSLAALLARRGRLRPGEVVTTVAPVAAALAHAHERGVVHGDLSPGNVVFTAAGRPVLTDLGTARLVGDTARAEMTPAYVDPVVARGGAPGPASDVFGVAAAAFHALTGIAPWNAADPGGTLAVAAAGELPDLALLAPEAPPELVQVVLRGLSAEPHLRGSAAAFALDLRHACRPEPVRLPQSGVPDAELGATGRGPNTELTHQVPGRRPPAAHAVPAPASRFARLRARLPGRRWGAGADRLDGRLVAGAVRRAGLAAVVLAAVGAALAGAVWAGTSWGGQPGGDPVPAAGTGGAPDGAGAGAEQGGRNGGPPQARDGAAGSGGGQPGSGEGSGTSTGPAEVPAEVPVEELPVAEAPVAEAPVGEAPADPEPADPYAAEPGTLADRPAAPADAAGWAALVGELYTRRSAAFATPDPDELAGVYVAGASLRERDAAQLASMAAAGQVLQDFTPHVVEVLEVTLRDPARVELLLVDTVPEYRVATTGSAGADMDGPATVLPARGEARVRMLLQLTDGGWRIADAALIG